MIKPIPTTRMAISFEMPNNEAAIGINNSEPPAIPETPVAEMADKKHSNKARENADMYTMVLAVANVMIDTVIAAPPEFAEPPSGIEIA